MKKPANPDAGLTLTLTQNPDILAILSAAANRPRLVIGFAAETDNVEQNAVAKRQRKGCDWIVANQVAGADNPVFGTARNSALLITASGSERWPDMLKTELAEKLAGQALREEVP